MDFSLITYHFILPMLEFFKNHLGSYGWAIIVVTILVKVILFPLTKHQTESMQKMQALQPKIKILQERFNQQKERHKDKPAKLKEAQESFQKDMMEFYQTNKVNPLGGCFPMLFQLPILIALFWAFNGSPFKPVAVTVPIEILNQNETLKEQVKGSSTPTIYVGKNGEKGRLVLNPGSIKIPAIKEITYKIVKLEGNINGITNNAQWELTDRAYYTPAYTPKALDAYADLSINPDNSVTVKTKKPGHVYLNAILPGTSAKDNFLFISGLGKTGSVDPATHKLNWDVIILVLLFTFTIWLSGKVTTGFSPPSSDPKQAEMQKTMQRMMPPMVGVMTLLFPVPSGVLLYFVVSGLFQALQTWMIMRKPIVNS
ncbi:MAG: membrane protein insertase YidC [Candidatus Melainabacteria bacterium]|nr:membrane protein insertase YidC [Candidatus Melainabacteria bacterium]